MATFVQSVTELVGTGDCTPTFVGDTTTGNLIVAIITWSGTATFDSISGSGMTFSLFPGSNVGPVTPNNANHRVMYAANITGATTPTVTAVLAGTFSHFRVRLIELSGTEQTPDGSAGVNNGTDSQVTVSATTTTDNEPVLGVAINQNDNLGTPTGYTIFDDDINDQGTSFYDVDVGAAGAQAVTFPFTFATGDWLAVAAAFKAGAASTDTAFSLVASLTATPSPRAIWNAAVSAPNAVTLTMVGTTRVVWRVPTNASAGTAVHVVIFSGASPTYSIVTQATTTVDASGFAIIDGSGNSGDKAFAFVHNYSDSTAATSIFGGPSVATIP